MATAKADAIMYPKRGVGVRSSLGLAGDLDDVALVEDIEQAFGVRLPDDEVSRCQTVGDLFELVVDRLPDRIGNADRCATAMCFYRLRRAVLTLAPDMELRPSTPIEALRGLSVKSLYHAFQGADGLRPPARHLSAWGGLSLLLVVALPIGLLFWEAPWWTAALSVLLAVPLYQLSPVRLPPQIKTFGDLVELVTARSIGTLGADGARLRSAEAWKALQTVCADHAATTGGEVGKSTLILTPRKVAL